MYAAMLRSLRCDKTEEIRVAFNTVLDLCIPEAILDCIRDLDKDLKAKAITDIHSPNGLVNPRRQLRLSEHGMHYSAPQDMRIVNASCSYDLLSKYPKLANVTHAGFISLVQNHGGINTLEASLKEHFSGCEINVTLTSYKTILVYACCKV